MNKVFLIILITHSVMFPQITLSRISFDFGIVHNTFYDLGDDWFYTYTPEIKIGGNFFKDQFEWDAYINYWNFNEEKYYSSNDAMYSYSILGMGIRINFYPQKSFKNFPIPFHIILGLSESILAEKYLSGSREDGSHRNNNYIFVTSADLGVGANFSITNTFRTRIEIIEYLHLNNKNKNLITSGQTEVIKLGIDYFL